MQSEKSTGNRSRLEISCAIPELELAVEVEAAIDRDEAGSRQSALPFDFVGATGDDRREQPVEELASAGEGGLTG